MTDLWMMNDNDRRLMMNTVFLQPQNMFFNYHGRCYSGNRKDMSGVTGLNNLWENNYPYFNRY